MSTSTLDGVGHGASGTNYLNAKKGLMSWLFTIDHKRIGVMYLATVLTFFLAGGLFALAIRTELATPAGDIFSAAVYNKLFTLHGAIMVFLVLVPAIPATLGNFLLPLQLGTIDVAFPKLNLLSFHIYVFGSLFLLYTLVTGGVDTGWTFYTPYSSSSADGNVVAALTGAFILGFSSILTGLNFIVTVHKMRAPGVTWLRMPLFVWAIYATSVIQVLATPVIAITLFLLIFEKIVGIGIFDPALGGDPVLFQHFFWFYSHPVVYVMVLPAFGVMSETITVHSRKHIFGYTAIAASSVAIAAVGFIIWGHHMFVSGQSELSGTVFSLLTFAVAIPTAIKLCSWIATLYKGSIQWNTPMLYSLGFLWIFAIGGLTGLFLATLATDVHLHDTYFVVAHFHYVMMGGVLFALVAGMHHWWPKITGKMYNDTIGRVTFVLSFIGYNLTFFPQFVAGSQGMPRRYHQYLPEFEMWNQLSTLGSYLFGLSLFIILGYLLQSLFSGKAAPRNPWGAASLEWRTQSPPVEHNFEGDVVCTYGPYDYEAHRALKS
ncbi:MAG: cytochrome c oxidase subunit I [Deltaproteobacteria bacterium]|jgi:cytochrome c oxidase subunit 1|nr:cytochrome c oxidase subunit I [Deltaproteobacteria bacterium]